MFFEEGPSPMAGAIDSYSTRMVWGSSITSPGVAGVVIAMGYKHPRLPQNAIHNIVKTTSAGTIPVVSAVRYVQQASGVLPRLVVGWHDQSASGIDKLNSGASSGSLMRWFVNFGGKYRLNKVTIMLSAPVDVNTTITPNFYTDDLAATKNLTVINSTNYPDSQRTIEISPEVSGDHNGIFELDFTNNTTALSVLLPIVLEWEKI